VAARLPKNYREPTGIRIDALQQDLVENTLRDALGLQSKGCNNRQRGGESISLVGESVCSELLGVSVTW
jgi:hypothetical protein